MQVYFYFLTLMKWILHYFTVVNLALHFWGIHKKMPCDVISYLLILIVFSWEHSINVKQKHLQCMLIVESGIITIFVLRLYFIIMCIGLVEWAGPHHEISWSVDSLHFTDSLCVCSWAMSTPYWAPLSHLRDCSVGSLSGNVHIAIFWASLCPLILFLSL